MPSEARPQPGRRSMVIGGIDWDEVWTVFERIARLAQRMADADLGHVTLVGPRIWTAASDGGRIASNSRVAQLAGVALAGREVLWFQDLGEARWRETYPLAEDEREFPFYAGAPVILPNGRRIGVLAIQGEQPRAFDADLAERLVDHAAFVADECARGGTLQELARTRHRLGLATEISKITVWEINYRDRTFSSSGAKSPLGVNVTYERMEADLWWAVHPRDRQACEPLWERHLQEGVAHRVVHRMMQLDGSHIWVESANEAVRDLAGNVVGVIGVIRNIDEEKRAEMALAKAKEDAEAANRAKSLFLATMSHEIRTPLNGVLGMAQAMAVDDLSAIQRERLGVVRASGEALLAILNDILDLAKIEAGKLDLEDIEFDLETVVRGAHSAFTAQANRKGLSFAFTIEGAEGVYRGDPTRVRQVLYNLVSNALKFTETGEIRVAATREGADLCIAVTDTGMGIPADRLSRLFGRFAQADASTTREFGGTGLGLAICRELCEMMGGAIAVESVPGQGSTFTIRLPLPFVGETLEPAGALAAARAKEAPPPLCLSVLAAEDNTVNQLVLKTLLHQVGIEPVVVANGREALAAWETREWDVILMDVQMPQMDGPTATAAIRAQERATGRTRTPIIALTANAMSHQVAEYIAAGMDGHVAKPIEASRLYGALEQILNDAIRAEQEERAA
ncbi:MAG TPA: ATP-binding protein [Caulobacteraceae bacterium]|nr:ATP-binding protein [Caulobacteraceae bacterium]